MIHKALRLFLVCLLTFSNISLLFAQETADSAQPKWHAWGSAGGKFGNDRQLGLLNFMAPLWQDERTLFFTDLRGKDVSGPEIEGNAGLGVRRIFGDEHRFIAGLYGFTDYLRSPNRKFFFQGTIGGEILTEHFDFRVNGYIPERGGQIIAERSVPTTSSTSVVLAGTSVVSRTISSGGALTAYEYAMPGFDMEAGYGLELKKIFQRLNFFKGQEIWNYIGYFHFNRKETPLVNGPRYRLEYRINDLFGFYGSRITAGYELQHDDIRGTENFFSIELRLPLEASPRTEEKHYLNGVEKRMMEYVKRDVDIVSFAQDINKAPGTEGGPVGTAIQINQTTDAPVTDPGTGQALNVYVVDQTGGGDCSAANPCTAAAAQADASYGAGDVVVLTSATGTIVGNVALVGADQQVLGAGGAGQVTANLTSGHSFTFLGLGARPTLQGSVTVLGNATVSGFDINGGATGITDAGVAASNVTVDDINISNSTGNGMNMTNSGSSFTVTNTTIATSGAAGVQLGGNGTFSFTGGTISGSTGAAVDVNAGSGNFTFANTALNNTTGRIVDITGRTGGTVSFSGNLSDTGTGVIVNNNTGGTTTFSGGTKTLNTGANAAVTLSSNTGHTINFTNGGLDIDTTTGTGFSASGGGTVNVSGAGNTVTSTNAKAVDLDTVTAGITFESVSSTSSGTQGLEFDSMSGAFAVTGTTTVTSNTNSGIDINGSSGTFTFGTTNISNRGAIGIDINGSAPTINFGTTTITNANSSNTRGIEITNMTGGSVTFATANVNQNNVASEALFASTNSGSLVVNGGTLQNVSDILGEVIDIDSTASISLNNLTVNGYNGDGIDISTNNNFNSVAQVTNSTTTGTGGGYGIIFNGFGTNDTINATLTNNTGSGNVFSDIQLFTRNNNVVCFEMTGNTGSQTVTASNTSTIRLPGYAGADNNTGQINTFINGNNPAAGNASSFIFDTGTITGGVACTTP